MDNCCYNRPFDDQLQLRIKLESEAKLNIQNGIRSGSLQLVWSYILEYENNKNPFLERKRQISIWKQYAKIDIQESPKIISEANSLNNQGIKKMDSLHIACAIYSKSDYFLTTDDKVLKRSNTISKVKIIDPFGFIKEVSL